MASLTRKTGFLLPGLAALALAACGAPSTSALNSGNAPELKTEFTQDSLIDIGNQLREDGDYAQALAFYRRAQGSDPTDYRSYKGIGLTLDAMGASAEALESLSRAAIINPRDAELQEALARIALVDGQLDKAQAGYQWLIAQDPTKSSYYNGLAITCDLSGDHAGAQANYSMAIGLAPANRALRNNLALSFAFSGNFAAAEDMLSDMQDTPRARQNLALIYGLAGERAKAEQTALLDLPMAAVEKNLAMYDTLRRLPSRQQAAMVLLGHPIGKEAAALSD